MVTRRDGRINRASDSRFGRSENLNFTGLNTGCVKPMTLKLILVASSPGARQGVVGSHGNVTEQDIRTEEENRLTAYFPSGASL